MSEPDIIVIGAGTVGASVAYGLVRLGRRVLMLDGGDTDIRAARANFGLVWVQGKGKGMPAYQRLSRRSSDLWPQFREELIEASGGMTIDYERRGGLVFAFGEDGFESRSALMRRMETERLGEVGGDTGPADIEMIERDRLQKMLPQMPLGEKVSGASYCWRDGHVNPLQTLAALHTGFVRLGGQLRSHSLVDQIRPEAGGFVVTSGDQSWRTAKVVICAGIATPALGRQVGLDVPIFPERGQVLVTQRVAPFLPYPCSGIRQTADGTIMIGATKEKVGEDVGTTVRASSWLARKTVDLSPALGKLQLVRHWSGLRIMTPDSCPIYAQSPEWPGAFVVGCHSGVTLAAAHTADIASHIAAGALPAALDPFHHRRFDVQAAR